MDYKQKYLKYKSKYLYLRELQNQEGSGIEDTLILAGFNIKDAIDKDIVSLYKKLINKDTEKIISFLIKNKYITKENIILIINTILGHKLYTGTNIVGLQKYEQWKKSKESEIKKIKQKGDKKIATDRLKTTIESFTPNIYKEFTELNKNINELNNIQKTNYAHLILQQNFNYIYALKAATELTGDKDTGQIKNYVYLISEKNFDYESTLQAAKQLTGNKDTGQIKNYVYLISEKNIDYESALQAATELKGDKDTGQIKNYVVLISEKYKGQSRNQGQPRNSSNDYPYIIEHVKILDDEQINKYIRLHKILPYDHSILAAKAFTEDDIKYAEELNRLKYCYEYIYFCVKELLPQQKINLTNILKEILNKKTFSDKECEKLFTDLKKYDPSQMNRYIKLYLIYKEYYPLYLDNLMKLSDNDFKNLEKLHEMKFAIDDAYEIVDKLKNKVLILIKIFTQTDLINKIKEKLSIEPPDLEFLYKKNFAIHIINKLNDTKIDIFINLFNNLMLEVELQYINLATLFEELINVSNKIKSDDISMYIKLRLIYTSIYTLDNIDNIDNITEFNKNIEAFIKQFKQLTPKQIDLAEELSKLYFDPKLIYNAITTLNDKQMENLIKLLEARLVINTGNPTERPKHRRALTFYEDNIKKSSDLFYNVSSMSDNIKQEIQNINIIKNKIHESFIIRNLF